MKYRQSYACGAGEKPLLGITVGDMFDQMAARYADKEALVVRHQNIRYTYQELKDKVDQCARGLLASGLKKGDRMGIWSPNTAEWVIIQFATSKIGVILVNINPSYRLNELEYALNQSECRAIVIFSEFKSSNYAQMLFTLAPELKEANPGQLRSEKLSALKTVICMGSENVPGMFNWNDLMNMADQVSKEKLVHCQNQLEFDDPINIQYTSGTTGFPKGATLSHHNILNNGYFVGEIMNFTDKDRLVIPVPLYHCFGMVLGNLACVTHGAAMLFPCPGFEPEAVLRMVEEEKATALHGVPTMFIAELDLIESEDYDLSSLRTGLMAGSPCPIEVMKKVIKTMHMTEVEIAYGMTETSPVSFQTRPQTPLDKRVGTVGLIHPHVEVKIIDPEKGWILPTGETGELCTRGYSIMKGYWNDKKKTRDSIDESGWMHTGDLAAMDEEGFVKIVGRIKDMVIRGGENIYPREIEEFLFTNPKVSDVQVIGVPDQKYGEELMAWVKLKDGEATDTEEMQSFCRDKIAHFKIPRYFKIVDDFPMTVTGKIQKFKMREQSIKELNLSISNS